MKSHADIDASFDNTLALYGHDEQTRANIEVNRAHAHARHDIEAKGEWIVRGSVIVNTTEPQSVNASRYFETKEQAEQEALLFPKYVKVRVGRVCGSDNGKFFSCWFDVQFSPNGVTGSKNETGIKRLKGFLKCAPGHIFTQDRILNFMTAEQFNALTT